MAEKKKAGTAPRPSRRAKSARRRRTRSRTPTRPTWAARPRRSPKATIDVVNASNEKVRDIVLHPDVFRAPREQAPPLRGGQAVPRRRPRAARTPPRTAPWSAARARSRGGRRAPAAPASARPARRCGGTAAPCSGPQPRDYSYDMPKKARAAALRSALSQRVQDGALKVVDALRHRASRRRKRAEGDPRQARRRGQDAARGQRARRDNLVLSGRNIPGVQGRATRPR